MIHRGRFFCEKNKVGKRVVREESIYISYYPIICCGLTVHITSIREKVKLPYTLWRAYVVLHLGYKRMKIKNVTRRNPKQTGVFNIRKNENTIQD